MSRDTTKAGAAVRRGLIDAAPWRGTEQGAVSVLSKSRGTDGVVRLRISEAVLRKAARAAGAKAR